MGLFKKKIDPISDRSKSLNAQIAALETQIKKLDAKLNQPPAVQVRSRSPVQPRVVAKTPARPDRPSPAPREPIFEKVDHRHLESGAEDQPTSDHFNDLGVRKYDLAAACRRLRLRLRGPPATNPKLVTYLAAGSIRGLRPLRYEKRVARNRFIALFFVLVCLLWGIFAAFVKL